MTLSELFEDWEDVSYRKKISILRTVVDYLDKNEDDEFVFNMLQESPNVEQDDYFGTEGLRG